MRIFRRRFALPILLIVVKEVHNSYRIFAWYLVSNLMETKIQIQLIAQKHLLATFVDLARLTVPQNYERIFLSREHEL